MDRRIAAATLVCTTMALAAATHAENITHTFRDGACVYMKNNDIEITEAAIRWMPATSRTGPFSGLVDTFSPMADNFLKNVALSLDDEIDGPLCHINSGAGILLATANFIDRSALHAAQGLGAIEEALGLKNTMVDFIKELVLALEGDDPAAQIDPKLLAYSEDLGNRAAELRKAIRRAKLDVETSAELQALVEQSVGELQTATYYSAQSGLGISVFVDYWDDAGAQERKDLVLKNERVGITSEFARDLPGRGGAMLANVGKAIRLAREINEALSKEAVENAEQAFKAEGSRARKQEAIELAEAIDASTEDVSIGPTPIGEAVAGIDDATQGPAVVASAPRPANPDGNDGSAADAMDAPGDTGGCQNDEPEVKGFRPFKRMQRVLTTDDDC